MGATSTSDNGRVYLATTALEEFRESTGRTVFLGPWCAAGGAKGLETDQMNILESPWTDALKLESACLYVNAVYERALAGLAENLDSIQAEKHSKRYWRILLGPWLMYYVPAVYDRYAALLRAFEGFPGLTTTVLAEESFITPADTLEFVQLLKDDPYNLQIYSRVLKALDRHFPQKKFEIRPSRFIVKGEGLKARLKGLASGALLSVGSISRQGRLIILKDSYFPNEVELALATRTLGRVWPIKGGIYELPALSTDTRTREDLSIALSKGKEGFERVLASMLAHDMPKAFLEGYGLIRRESERYPTGPRAILSAGGWYYDEPFKKWAASSSEEGTLLLGMQHGGNYGSLKYHQSEDHEISITDRYYTWGWEKKDRAGKTIPRPSAKLSGRKMLGADNLKDAILFGATALPRYLFQFPNHPGRFSDYLAWQARFVSAMPKGLLAKTRARLHKADYGWSIAKRWKAMCPEVALEGWERPFTTSLAACRLYVCDHLSTTFTEALSANKPVILFWDPTANELRDEAALYYDMLIKAGILFYSPEEAAKAVSEVYGDIEGWWNAPARQDARKAFTDRFALTSMDITGEWVKELEGLIKDGLRQSPVKRQGADA